MCCVTINDLQMLSRVHRWSEGTRGVQSVDLDPQLRVYFVIALSSDVMSMH